VLMALDGGDPDELAEGSREFSRRLRGSGHFTLVENGAQTLVRGHWSSGLTTCVLP
jgi:hypothetical protein